jgi:hypothetical protein
MADHEQRPGDGGGEVDAAEVGLERRVVAEPFRLLIGVHMAAHPGDQGRVVHDLTVGLVHAQVSGE